MSITFCDNFQGGGGGAMKNPCPMMSLPFVSMSNDVHCPFVFLSDDVPSFRVPVQWCPLSTAPSCSCPMMSLPFVSMSNDVHCPFVSMFDDVPFLCVPVRWCPLSLNSLIPLPLALYKMQIQSYKISQLKSWTHGKFAVKTENLNLPVNSQQLIENLQRNIKYCN